MTSPEEEFNYDLLEQEIYVGKNYKIRLSFYDNALCGPLMRVVCLENCKSKKHILLMQDGPMGNGLPCFFDDEFLAVITSALRDPRNLQSPKQIIACLTQLHECNNALLQALEKQCNLQLLTQRQQFAWSREEIAKQSHRANTLKQTTREAIQRGELAEHNRGPYPANLNQVYPMPTVKFLSSFSIEVNEKSERIYTDSISCLNDSVRSKESWWGAKEREFFEDFIRSLPILTTIMTNWET